MTTDSNAWIRTGAVLFILWGIAHIIVGVAPLVSYFSSGPAAMLSFAEFNVDPSDIDPVLRHATSIIAEYYADITALGILAIIVSVGLIWKNRPLGFWINFIVLGIADAAFTFFEIVPGYQPLLPPFPLIGVSLYVLGAAFTAIGFLQIRRPSAEVSG